MMKEQSLGVKNVFPISNPGNSCDWSMHHLFPYIKFSVSIRTYWKYLLPFSSIQCSAWAQRLHPSMPTRGLSSITH